MAKNAGVDELAVGLNIAGERWVKSKGDKFLHLDAFRKPADQDFLVSYLGWDDPSDRRLQAIEIYPEESADVLISKLEYLWTKWSRTTRG